MAPGLPSSYQLPGESERRVEKQRWYWLYVKWPIGLGGKGNDGIAAFVHVCRVQLVTLNMLTLSRTTWLHQTDLR